MPGSLSMKPFAYQYLQLNYDSLEANEVRSTLRAIYEYVMTQVNPQPQGFGPDIDVFYPDGTRLSVTLDERFKVKVDLDYEAFLLEARGMIDADKAAWKKWTDEATARRKANGQDEDAAFTVTFTGSRRTCDYTEGEIADRLTEQRQWRWKTVEEIDWAAQEKELEKVD